MKSTLTILAIASLVALAGCKKERTPTDYRLPDSFEGGFAIVYEKADAPPLPIVDGRRQATFGADGLLRTSDKPLEGWAKDRYFVGAAELGAGSQDRYGADGVLGSGDTACVFRQNVVCPDAKADQCREDLMAKLRASCGM